MSKQIFDQIFDLIKSMIQEFYQANDALLNDSITMDSKLVDDLKLDVYEIQELIMSCEENYFIDIDDPTIESINTIRDLVNAVKTEIDKKKAAEKEAAETKISVETTEEPTSATEGETQPEEQTMVAETVTMEEIE